MFILLHGTGRNEEDLLLIASMLDIQANILSIRGDENEKGALRFFKRRTEGLYDIDDLMNRGQKLAQFLNKFIAEKAFDLDEIYLIGFSNGTNMAMNLLVNQHTKIKKAFLFAPMYPAPLEVSKRIQEVSVYLSMGKSDPIVSLSQSHRVQELFEKGGAQIETFWVHTHEITGDSLQAAKNWLVFQ